MLVDTHLIRSFLALRDLGSVTAAAHSLGLQQPTVSLHLKALREAFDDPLFVRQGGRMLPTPRAQILVTHSREILERLAQLTDPAPSFDAGSSNRTFHLAMTDASQVTLLPDILNYLAENAPNISLSVSLLDQDLAARLAEGKIDLALGYIPWLKEGCRQRALYSQDWVCLTHRNFGMVDRKAYEASDHVLVASGTGASLLEQATAAAGIQRKIKLVLPGFLGLASIIGSQNYIATTPRHTATTLAELDKRLKLEPLPFPAPGFRVCQYWHDRFDRDPPNIWLRKACSDLFANRSSVTTGGA